MTVVGVDGWGDGWVAARLDGDRVTWTAYRQPRHSMRDAFARLLDEHPGSVVAVDIPIGIVNGTRRSDAAAQRFLREKGATPATVFPTPSASVVRAFVDGRTHREAMASRPPGTGGTSIQAWNLIAKMVEVRDALASRPNARVVEAHPECSFRELCPSIAAAGKKTGRGAGLRVRALSRQLVLPDLVDAPDGVPVDDLLDAVAVAWTARRVAAGCARFLPGDPRPGEPTIAI